MLKEERQQAILNEVAVHNRILLTDIAESLDVSVDTVRRDVKELDAENRLRKVHGGAVSVGFITDNRRNANVYALDQKITIAQKAQGLIKDGGVVFIDGGTTCLELTRAIPKTKQLTCFTLSLPVALELSRKPNIKVVLIGGEVTKEAQIAVGSYAIHQLSEVRFDFSFIGTGYVDPEFGLTEFDWDVVQVKKAVIKSSKKTVLLSISEKLNSQHRYRTCEINAIHTMITELEASDHRLDAFRNQYIHIL